MTTPNKANRYVAVSFAHMKRPVSVYGHITGENGHHENGIDETDVPSAHQNGSLDSAVEKSFRTVLATTTSSPLPELLNDRYSTAEPAFDVVIVGGGLSGLTAAYTLRKSDPSMRVLVLEAKSHVGGRTVSRMLNTVTGTRRFDLGDQWVNSTQRETLELLDELDLVTYSEYKDGKNMLIYPDGKTELFANNVYPINFFRRFDISTFVSRIESMRKDLSIEDPTDWNEALKWDAVTLEQFKMHYIWTDLARQVFDALVVLHFGVTPREMSLLFFCHALNCVGGWKVFFGEGEEFPTSRELKIKGGAQEICERLATEVDRSNLRLSDPVIGIDQSNPDLVLITTESGCKYRAKRVIVATSVGKSVRISHTPEVPLKRESLAQLMPTGNCIKYVVTYEKAFWRKNDMSGHVMKLSDEEKAFDVAGEMITYEFTFDACACNKNVNFKGVENPALMGMIYSETLRQLKPDQRQKRILKKLADIFGTEALRNIDYAEMDWGTERFTTGFPFSVMTPGALIYHGKALMKPLGRVHWAGAETATNWFGHMEGSVQAGKRAATEVRKKLDPASSK